MVRQVDDDSLEPFDHDDKSYSIRKEVFKVNTALIVYSSNKDNNYMEKINFKENPEDRSMMAVGSSPVRMKDIHAMRRALDMIKINPKKNQNSMTTTNFEGMLPGNIIYWSRTDYRKIIWTMDPEIVHIEMSHPGNTYDIPMDKILFATDGNALKGFLIPKVKKLHENSGLDQLPLPNFYSSNNMCNGSTELHQYDTMEGYLKAWEDRVFLTKYSNENMGVGGLDGLKKLNGKKRLPIRYRIPSDVTIKNLIEWIER